MNNTLCELEKQAMQQAKQLGHTMSTFAFAYDSDHSMSEAYCHKCEAYAQVTPKQKNPQLRITGPAPYIECRFKAEGAQQ